jgi:uncharacterized protein YdeI (YjbR/CyaY-like superfamily)
VNQKRKPKNEILMKDHLKAVFFEAPAAFREWLEKYHASANALLVGYYKKGSRTPSITWPESVDQALCFGWIDGVRKSIDHSRYTIRFTPRKRGSVWSSVNIRRARALITEGLMHPAGRTAYQARKLNRSGIYSYEQRSVNLQPPYDRLMKRNKTASRFLEEQPASYRKAVSWWIVSAKKEQTRLKRLEKLVAYSAQGQRIPQLRRKEPAG